MPADQCGRKDGVRNLKDDCYRGYEILGWNQNVRKQIVLQMYIMTLLRVVWEKIDGLINFDYEWSL